MKEGKEEEEEGGNGWKKAERGAGGLERKGKEERVSCKEMEGGERKERERG